MPPGLKHPNEGRKGMRPSPLHRALFLKCSPRKLHRLVQELNNIFCGKEKYIFPSPKRDRRLSAVDRLNIGERQCRGCIQEEREEEEGGNTTAEIERATEKPPRPPPIAPTT